MRKFGYGILFIGFIFIITSESLAQKPYVKLGVGYGFNYGTKYTLYNFKNYGGARDEINGTFASFGKGVTLGGAFGYMLNDYVGLEMGISYLLGSSIESEYYVSSGTNYTTTSDIFKGRMLEIIPAIVITSGSEGIRPYARFGLIIGLSGKILTEQENVSSTSFSQSLSTQKAELSGGTAWGFNGAAGAIFPLNPSLSLFTELNLVSLSFAPQKGVITEYKVNNQDLLYSLPPNQREIEFVDEYVDYGDPNAPAQDLKTYYPFSSIGLNVGLIYSF